MAQHDYTIANQGFPAFRSDLNDALAAIVSNNSGATEPTTMFAHQVWVDTAANPSVLKIRNADNDAWITVGVLDQTGDTFILRPAAGSATVPAYSTTSDTNTGVYFPGADRVGITTGGTQRVEVDASGNVGVGVTPSAWGSGTRGIDIGSGSAIWNPGSGTQTQLLNNSFNNGTNFIYKNTGTAARYRMVGDQHEWYIAPSGTAGNAITFTQAMTLDASGNLLVGTTSVLFSSLVTFEKNGGNTLSCWQKAGSSASAIVARIDDTTGRLIGFNYAGTTDVGTITTNGSSTSYNTSSDYRLKENVAPMTGALAKVLELNPVTYTWKANGSAGEGFIAHELQAVCPDAVTGEKDAVEIRQVEVSPAVPATYDDEGNELTPAVEAVYEEREVPVYQGVDTSFLVATLTAAIQELSAKNDALEARIAALENA